MKIGDYVYCKFSFIVETYNIREESITLKLLNPLNPSRAIDQVTIPMYMPDLGLYLPMLDRVQPGSYLDINHPDYYRPYGNDSTIITYKNKPYQISLDKDFQYTGKYYLKPAADNSSLKVKFAKLRTEAERTKILGSLLDMDFNGTEINGFIINFIQKDTTGDFVKFLPDINPIVYNPRTISKTPIYAILQEPSTFLQFTFPCSYLKLDNEKHPISINGAWNLD